MPDAGAPDMHMHLNATVGSLMAELDALSRIIADARLEVAALRADDGDAPDIPAATDELAAIVSHTAQATHEILDSCESLSAVSGKLGQEYAQPLDTAITRIYEACSFQDITGQRIAKVVAALQAVERRIAGARQGMLTRPVVVVPPPPATPAAPESLLNGPQMPGAGISQSAIDALFD
ncbi:protein phosphatase CheZ [Falsiroseomonas selenitidurans]|uniref:Protein phosphatase CheZ n=1 Tax=Falsiroseomonas selenitidurans TaxID=2716335 RepID=A0ABX1E3D5_9PROT|nr:protein phosphatase CheZ [Falsiroseomonas selenitidurans]NKC31685.1 protein phosphatase CheZ [Falsiroseomonas selenitidurans]